MKLADEIIESLSSDNSSLTEALLKTKVLLYRIGHKELVEWVNRELNGYGDNDEIPEYRILPAQVLANVANIAMQFNSHPIPIRHLSEEQRNSLENSKMGQSLAVLEKLVSTGKGDRLQTPIPLEWNGILGKTLAPGMAIQRAWCEIGVASINGIFIQVRSRLLDFLLELNDKIPGEPEAADAKRQFQEINTPAMFKHAIFGDNTTILVGSSNNQTVSNVKARGDFNLLAGELREQNVSETDVEELRAAIDADSSEVEKHKGVFGPQVKAWIDRVASGLSTAAGNIEIGIVANILSSKLQQYYGWLF